MTAALALGMVLGGAAAVITYYAVDARLRLTEARLQAKLADWERIARHHNALRADAGQVSSDR